MENTIIKDFLGQPLTIGDSVVYLHEKTLRTGTVDDIKVSQPFNKKYVRINNRWREAEKTVVKITSI